MTRALARLVVALMAICWPACAAVEVQDADFEVGDEVREPAQLPAGKLTCETAKRLALGLHGRGFERYRRGKTEIPTLVYWRETRSGVPLEIEEPCKTPELTFLSSTAALPLNTYGIVVSLTPMSYGKIRLERTTLLLTPPPNVVVLTGGSVSREVIDFSLLKLAATPPSSPGSGAPPGGFSK